MNQTQYDLTILIQRAIRLLQQNTPQGGQPYIGAFSGGKDSVVIKELAKIAGAPVEWHYHNTTIDPPELIYFIREHHRDVIWDKPPHGNFFVRAEKKKGFPMRQSRWCCEDYKEHKYPNRTVILGVRIAESRGRTKKWPKCVMEHEKQKTLSVLPIRLWSDDQVWQFIRDTHTPYCKLYDEGFQRLGCIGCPLMGPERRKKEFARWPNYEKRWRLMFQRVWERRTKTQPLQRDGREWFGSALFDNATELFEWWNDGQRNITQWKKKRDLKKCQKQLI